MSFGVLNIVSDAYDFYCWTKYRIILTRTLYFIIFALVAKFSSTTVELTLTGLVVGPLSRQVMIMMLHLMSMVRNLFTIAPEYPLVMR